MELKVDASNNKFANAAVLIKENLDMLLYKEDQEEEALDAARKIKLDLSEM